MSAHAHGKLVPIQKLEVSKMNFKVPVFFNDHMVCLDNDSFSPSAGKPAAVVNEWQRLFGDRIVLRDFEPVTASDLALAHDRKFVDGVLKCDRPNGFGNTLQSVAATLPYTTGAMLAAAHEAVWNGLVAVAPVSGFHHAGYESCGGFCTFNGLMVTALGLINHSVLVNTVGILDLDQHYGNGTDDIIDTLELDDVVHYSAGGDHSVPSATEFLRRLPALIDTKFADCDVLLYQAGADPHIDDPLGGWMTTEQLQRRDEIVFATCATMKLPLAWNLAGGYQDPLQKVLDIHNNTMAVCTAVYNRVLMQ